MSNKNLKVYRILFMTEIGEMQFKVKFPCKLKVVWKRSNQSAQTTVVSVENGIANFNQTIKLYINMYYDTNKSVFVEKKCLYSFLIITDKGQKSAGSVTCDLAELFNKRLYEMKQQFLLQKCPLPDTKIHMKIYYEQSLQQGYDSMSRISTQNLDISTASVDLSELGHSNSDIKNQEKNIESDSTSKQQNNSYKILSQSNLDILNESDLDANSHNKDSQSGEKMSQNIQALSSLTGKINQFVTKCSGNIKSELETLRLKNSSLSENLNQQKIQKQRLDQQNRKLKEKLSSLETQFQNSKVQFESKFSTSGQTIAELQQKLEKSNKLCAHLQTNLETTGQSQNTYISDIKTNYEESEKKLKQKIAELNDVILDEKKQKNAYIEKQQTLSEKLSRLNDKLSQSEQKNQQLSRREETRERQLSQIRYKMQTVYEKMTKQLGEAFK